MTRSIRVAALQLRALDRAEAATGWQHCLDSAEEAAQAADLLVLPEATVPAYVLGDDRIDDSEVTRAVDSLRLLAERTATVVVAGIAQRKGDRLRNRALAIDRDGSIAGYADKLFLWHFDRRWFEAGDSIAPVQTSLGCLGILVCADGRMPGIARALVDQGAEMLVMPTAWVTSGRDPHALENAQADLLARVRAFENGVPFAAANKCGTENAMVAYCGKSQIVDAHGSVVALASEGHEEAIHATLEVGAPRPHRAPLPAAIEPREAAGVDSLRVMIATGESPADIEERLAILGDAILLTPQPRDRGTAWLNERIPSIVLDDDAILDPGTLIRYRLAGYRLIIWRVSNTSPWIETVARARAMELRIYLVVFDREADRALAIDPDGSVVAGTFGHYRMASFSIDPQRSAQTELVPGTDVTAGLERVEAILRCR